MNIIIIGGGFVGYSLAEQLSTDIHQITLIEVKQDLCNNINSKLDVFTITGSGTDPAILKSAGIKNADMFIAVTESDDSNLVCCNFAKQYGITKRIARINTTYYTDPSSTATLQELGVTHIIEPEKEIVNCIMEYIKLPGFTESANFQSDNVFLRGYKITEDMPFANKSLSEIAGIAGSAQLLIVLIIRNGESIFPHGSERILVDDEIVAIMPRESIGTFRKLINLHEYRPKKIIISGDSLTAIHLAEALEPLADRIMLVDPDRNHGREAAAVLNKTEVLYGDCTGVEVLQEVHVADTPFFIAAGIDSEDNIMACLLAKAEGAREVIAVTNNQRHINLFQSLGVDHVINPRKITSQKIIESIIKVPISTLLNIKHADVEVSRFIVGKKSAIMGKPLHTVTGLSGKSIIIGCVFRDDHVIIPSGKTVIEEKDEVLVICPPENMKLAQKLFKTH